MTTVSPAAPMREGKVVQGPSQGTVYYVVGEAATRKFYNDLLPPPQYLFFDPVKEQPNYLVVEVKGKKALTVSAHKSGGTLLRPLITDRG